MHCSTIRRIFMGGVVTAFAISAALLPVSALADEGIDVAIPQEAQPIENENDAANLVDVLADGLSDSEEPIGSAHVEFARDSNDSSDSDGLSDPSDPSDPNNPNDPNNPDNPDNPDDPADTPKSTVARRDGNLYYFKEDGSVLTGSGWHKVESTWYYADDESGRLHEGWLNLDDAWYWFDDEAVMATGWNDIKGKRYWFRPSGAMATGWKQLDGAWYYLRPSGAMATSWVKDGGAWYHLSKSGTMDTGWTRIDGDWYYLRPSGAAATGWVMVDGAWYYLNPSSCSMATGWLKDGNAWYYLKGSGRMATGWTKVGEDWYYLNSSGQMVTGWMRDGGAWYFLKPSGQMVTGWLKQDGNWYHLKGSGAMDTGWKRIGDTWYYLSPSSGRLDTGWFNINGTWYWQDTHGCPCNELRIIGGINYAFDSSCAWRTVSYASIDDSMNGKQSALVRQAWATPSYGPNLCAAWVTTVFRNAGYHPYQYDACDMYRQFCFSSSLAALKPGMVVAVNSHPHTSAGYQWGHAGIYVGDGLVVENVPDGKGGAFVRVSDLGSWIWWYGASNPVKWGWYGNVPLR